LSDIKKSKLFPFPVNEEVALRNLFEGILQETELGEISDVLISNPDDEDILQYNSSLMVWENVPLPTLPIGNLDDIGDVVITTVADGDVLTWDSGTSRWVNEAPTGGGGTPGGTGTQLQFRNGTSFGGVLGTVWDGTTLTLPSAVRIGPATGVGARSIVGFDELSVQYDHPTDTGSYARLEMGRTGSNQTSWTLEAVGDAGNDITTFTFTSGSTAPEFNGNGMWHAGNFSPSSKQDTLASGTNIRTVDNQSLVGSGNVDSKPIEAIGVACSDETTDITAGTAKVTFRMPYAFTLTGVRASLSTAQPSGSIFTVDINEAGTSILSTKLTIDNTELTSTTAATAPVISDTSLADDAQITVDVDQIGTTGARGLKVWLIGRRT
jgi:hypothetical protein